MEVQYSHCNGRSNALFNKRTETLVHPSQSATKNLKKLISVIASRPQFIKASVLSKSIADTEVLQEVILHTSQHFDKNI